MIDIAASMPALKRYILFFKKLIQDLKTFVSQDETTKIKFVNILAYSRKSTSLSAILRELKSLFCKIKCLFSNIDELSFATIGIYIEYLQDKTLLKTLCFNVR